MKNSKTLLLLIAALAVIALLIIRQPAEPASDMGDVSEDEHVSMYEHAHAIGLHPDDPSLVYVGAHNGLYLLQGDEAERLGDRQDDFMGFVPHPTDPDVFFASGHDAKTGANLGLIASEDGGQTWQQRSEGVNGPVDFHFLVVSPTDPMRLYGLYEAVPSWQMSTDGGYTWTEMPLGSVPLPIFFAADPLDADSVWAATIGGIYRSDNRGETWEEIPLGTLNDEPAFAIALHPDGFDAGIAIYQETGGISVSTDGGTTWESPGKLAENDPVLHIVWSMSDTDMLYAMTRSGAIYRSRDAGTSWVSLTEGEEGPHADEDDHAHTGDEPDDHHADEDDHPHAEGVPDNHGHEE